LFERNSVLNLFPVLSVSRFRLIFLAALLGFLTAEFPDNAARTELAVEAGVGAGLAQVQALLAVAQFMLLAIDGGFPLRMKTAVAHEFHK
jgi:hypothetical protein